MSDNAFDDVRRAVWQAGQWQKAVDSQTATMLHLCKHRIRASGASNETLAALKKELRDYNIHTGKWKGE